MLKRKMGSLESWLFGVPIVLLPVIILWATKAHMSVLKRVADLEGKLSLVSETVIPISSAMRELLIKQLTHPHTPRTDFLLTKVGPPYTLTPDEEAELFESLAEWALNTNEDISDSERGAALLLPEIIKRAERESLLPAREMIAITVLVPKDQVSSGLLTAGLVSLATKANYPKG